MSRAITTADVIVSGRQEMLRATMARRSSWRRVRVLPRILGPDDWLGRHPGVCLVLVAALLLFSCTF